MKLITSSKMREVDRKADEMGIKTSYLMERAGRGVAEEVRKALGGVSGKRGIVFVGPGNNGGDALVCARYLHDWGCEILIFMTRRKEDENLRLVRERGIRFINTSELRDEIKRADFLVDGFFGTGKLRPLEGEVKEALLIARENKKLTIAIDLPSGLDADTGEYDPATLPADITVTLACPKEGLYKFPGAGIRGEVIVKDIGIPESLLRDIETELLDPSLIRSLLPERPLDAHKGTFGRLLVISGSKNYIGAAYLACMGAIRCGTGLVTLATPDSIHPILASKLTEATHIPLPDEDGYLKKEASKLVLDEIKNFDALVIGCGLSLRGEVVDFIREVLFSLPEDFPVLIDADALNTLSATDGWEEKIKAKAILSPHPGEMSRLTGLKTADIQKRRFEVAREFSKRWNKTLVLKGAFTVVAYGEKLRVSPFSNPGLASGGTGDVLAGIIGGFLAQGIEPFDSASLGVYIHALSGERVKNKLGDQGMMASDLLPEIPKVIKHLKSGDG